MKELDIVELVRPVGRHPVGGRGTLVSLDADHAIVEIVDPDGSWDELLSVTTADLRIVTSARAA